MLSEAPSENFIIVSTEVSSLSISLFSVSMTSPSFCTFSLTVSVSSARLAVPFAISSIAQFVSLMLFVMSPNFSLKSSLLFFSCALAWLTSPIIPARESLTRFSDWAILPISSERSVSLLSISKERSPSAIFRRLPSTFLMPPARRRPKIIEITRTRIRIVTILAA